MTGSMLSIINKDNFFHTLAATTSLADIAVFDAASHLCTTLRCLQNQLQRSAAPHSSQD